MSDPIQAITMPKWGLAMEEGLLAAWHVEAGAEISKGQQIADIETEKITNSFESPATGPLRRIVAEAGETLPVGALLGVVSESSVSDADIDAYVRANANSAYHPCGSCKMGNDEMAVVDPELRVHGIEKLRVADASIMPAITNGNINAPCMMIGERAADLIRNA